MIEYLKRFKNVGTIMSLVGFVGLLLIQFGMELDMMWLEQTTNIICAILVILGIANNPDSPGLDTPFKQLSKEE